MRLTLAIFITVVFLLPASHVHGGGKKTYGDIEGIVYIGNYDGDTMRVDIPGVHPLFGANIPVRFRGIDTPEIRADCRTEKKMALDAKERVNRLLEKAKHITLRETGRDKYFRIVARVVADGVDVGSMLLKEGLAVPYDGGRKDNAWCTEDTINSRP